MTLDLTGTRTGSATPARQTNLRCTVMNWVTSHTERFHVAELYPLLGVPVDDLSRNERCLATSWFTVPRWLLLRANGLWVPWLEADRFGGAGGSRPWWSWTVQLAGRYRHRPTIFGGNAPAGPQPVYWSP